MGLSYLGHLSYSRGKGKIVLFDYLIIGEAQGFCLKVLPEDPSSWRISIFSSLRYFLALVSRCQYFSSTGQ